MHPQCFYGKLNYQQLLFEAFFDLRVLFAPFKKLINSYDNILYSGTRTRSIGMVSCHNHRVPIEVPLSMQPNFDILYLCVY